MKLYKLQKLQKRRHFVAGRFIVGIDPGKARHQAQILDPDGLPLGSSFSFPTTFTGYNERLWQGLQSRLPAPFSELPRHKLAEHLVFAVEASCNLWPTLVDYLEAQHGRIVMVSPLATCHHRPAKSGTFSRTDCKDAFLVADLARQGTFLFRETYTPEQQALHRLSITYDKLRKDLQRCRARLRAQVEVLFPEFAKRLKLNSLTARHLLGRYLTPEDFLDLDLEREAAMLRLVSHEQHGRETLLELQALARHSVGVRLRAAERIAERLTMDSWLVLIEARQRELARVSEELIELARATPYHAPLVSLKGVSDLLAALFIAELRGSQAAFPDPSRSSAWPATISTCATPASTAAAGASATWVTADCAGFSTRWPPRPRSTSRRSVDRNGPKYLRRRLGGHANRQQNLVAALPQLLALIVALLRERRLYEERPEAIEEVRRLEAELERRKKGRRHSPGRSREAAA